MSKCNCPHNLCKFDIQYMQIACLLCAVYMQKSTYKNLHCAVDVYSRHSCLGICTVCKNSDFKTSLKSKQSLTQMIVVAFYRASQVISIAFKGLVKQLAQSRNGYQLALFFKPADSNIETVHNGFEQLFAIICTYCIQSFLCQISFLYFCT